MTARERLTKIYRGQSADRIGWAPLIDKKTLSYYPDAVKNAGEIDFIKKIGGDVISRCLIHKIENDSVNITRTAAPDSYDDSLVSEVYETRLGTMQGIFSKNAKFFVEPFLKSAFDFKIQKYIVEQQRCVADYAAWEKLDRATGEDGITAAIVGSTPVQQLLQRELGVQGFYFALMDYPRELEALMQAMHQKNLEIYETIARGPQEVVIIVENTSTTMISPEIYEKYSVRHVSDYVDIMHRHGKIAIVHMCGLLNDLLPLIKRTKLDGIDCLTPAPTGNIDFSSVYRELGGNLVVHGVIDPTDWLTCPVSEIEANVRRIITPEILRHPFVLCNAADGLNVPLERFTAVSRAIKNF